MEKEKEIFNQLLSIFQLLILIIIPVSMVSFVANTNEDQSLIPPFIFSTLIAMACIKHLNKFYYEEGPQVGKIFYSAEFNKAWGYNIAVQWEITDVNLRWGYENFNIKSDKGLHTIAIKDFYTYNFQIIEKKNPVLAFIRIFLKAKTQHT